MKDTSSSIGRLCLVIIVTSFMVYMYAIHMRTGKLMGYLENSPVIMLNGEEATESELTVAIPHISTYEYDEVSNTLIVEIK